jgi:hypothetical protein
MRMSFRNRTILLLVVVLALLLLVPAASAHEPVVAGPYTLEVGWVNEPPYAGQLNRLELNVFNTESKEPVDGLQDTLKFTVEFGGQSVDIPLRPVADGEEVTPGAYTADILPTVRGVYTFHFTGKINDTAVDAKVDVDEVQPATAVQFPAVAEPANEIAPLRDELATTRLIAIAGVVAGVLGIVAGVVMGRRK